MLARPGDVKRARRPVAFGLLAAAHSCCCASGHGGVSAGVGAKQPAQEIAAKIGQVYFNNSGVAVVSRQESKDVYIPLPVYRHERAAPREAGIAKALANDLLGDALEPTDAGGDVKVQVARAGEMAAAAAGGEAGVEGEETEHGSHPKHHLGLLFFFVSLGMGCTILLVLERMLPTFPYTCALFMAGFLVSIVHHIRTEGGPTWLTWFQSVAMWEEINPHTIFYAFLPALIFGEAMRLNVQLVTTCFWQVFLLACPGVILGAFLTGAFAKYILPYGWDWPIALVFGSILSATDPVAVVALFNTLGVSPRLTMLIAGESLLNDGTAIVLFALMLKVAMGASISVWSVATFAAHMTITATVFGLACGTLAVIAIGICAEENYHSDAMIQVVVTICCGYLVFFIGEHELETSGVISTVCAGFVIAFAAWPRFVSKETMHIVWETIEFIGNTVIFFLAGLIFGNCVLSRWGFIGFSDVGWLFVLYFGLTLVRATMVGVLWVPLNLVGRRLQWQEGAVMVWTGLRGAVSLALAIIVDIEPAIDERMGSRIMFHVGGMAALTFIVNSTTAAPLLRALGLAHTSRTRQQLIRQFSTHMSERCANIFDELIKSPDDVRFSGASPAMVRAMVPALQGAEPAGILRKDTAALDPAAAEESASLGQMAEKASTSKEDAEKAERALAQIYREMHLQVVQHHYWKMIEEGVVPRNLKVTRILIHSTNEALDNSSVCLNDWDVIARVVNLRSPSAIVKMLGEFAEQRPFCWIPEFASSFKQEFRIMFKVYAILCFMEAHARARQEVPTFFGKDTALDTTVQEVVARESEQETQKAAELLAQLPRGAVQMGKSELLSRKLLNDEMGSIGNMLDKGLLSRSEANHLEHKVTKALRRIFKTPKRQWASALEGGALSWAADGPNKPFAAAPTPKAGAAGRGVPAP
jgi:NhaP-type Na+/H+ or K+/H+ antiporter